MRAICFKVFWLFFLVSRNPGEGLQLELSKFSGVPEDWVPVAPPERFVQVGQKFYYIERSKNVTWFAAANICAQKKATLASIDSEEEQNLLNNYLAKNRLISWFWVSGNDFEKADEYRWFGFGKPMSHTFWAPGQPNNSNEHCVQIIYQMSKYVMHNRRCTVSTNFICEKITPSTVAITFW